MKGERQIELSRVANMVDAVSATVRQREITYSINGEVVLELRNRLIGKEASTFAERLYFCLPESTQRLSTTSL
jgi:hypothetical protein